MTMEKTYTFYNQKSGQKNPEEIIVKESDLTDQHLQLIMGDLMNYYDRLPDKIKTEFTKSLVDKYLMENQLTVSNNLINPEEYEK